MRELARGNEQPQAQEHGDDEQDFPKGGVFDEVAGDHFGSTWECHAHNAFKERQPAEDGDEHHHVGTPGTIGEERSDAEDQRQIPGGDGKALIFAGDTGHVFHERVAAEQEDTAGKNQHPSPELREEKRGDHSVCSLSFLPHECIFMAHNPDWMRNEEDQIKLFLTYDLRNATLAPLIWFECLKHPLGAIGNVRC